MSSYDPYAWDWELAYLQPDATPTYDPAAYDPYAWDWELPYLQAAAVQPVIPPPAPAPVLWFDDPPPAPIAVDPPPVLWFDDPPPPPVAFNPPLPFTANYEEPPMTEALMMNANTGERRQVATVTDALNLLKTRNWSLYNPTTMREIVIAVAPMSGVYPHLVYDTAHWDLDNMIMVDSGTPSIFNGYVGDRMTLRDWWTHLQNPNLPPPAPILAFDGPPAPPIDTSYNPFTDPFIHPDLLPAGNTPADPQPPEVPTPLWLQIIQQTDQAYASGQLSSSMLQTALNVLRSTTPPYPAVVDEKISAWQFTLDNNLLGDQLPPSNPAVPEPEWLTVIRTIDAANAEGRLTSAMLRSGLATLEQTPAPVPALVLDKIAEWKFTLDNNLLGDLPTTTEPPQPLPPLPAPAGSQPSLLTLGLIALAAVYLLKR